jgi:hypothetical protein
MCESIGEQVVSGAPMLGFLYIDGVGNKKFVEAVNGPGSGAKRFLGLVLSGIRWRKPRRPV